MRYLFVLNPRAGRQRKSGQFVDAIDDAMHQTRHKYEFAYTNSAGDATRIAQDAVKEKFDIVVAVGGDGTVNEVARGLIHSESSLGILPTGSGNGVARSLRVPLGFNENLQFLSQPRIIKIDTGRVNQKSFIGVSGTGYDALIGKRFQEFGVRGPIPYFLIGLKELLIYRARDYSIEFDGEVLETEALLVAFANTIQYGNGAIIAPQANPTDGFLDLCIIKPLSFAQALRTTSMLFKGNIDKSASYMHKKCRSIKINSSADQLYLHRDGEPDDMAESLTIRIEEKSLKVCSGL